MVAGVCGEGIRVEREFMCEGVVVSEIVSECEGGSGSVIAGVRKSV